VAKWLDAEIREKIQWTDRHFSLRISGYAPDFKAGQFLRVGLEVDGEIIARPYSLVNTPDEDLLEIFFNIVHEGPLTPRLVELEQGDRILLAPKANGFLVIDEVPECEHLWMFATGTGIGPFLSILKTPQVWQRFERITLAYSVRLENELAYMPLINELVKDHPQQFMFIPVVTREIVPGALNKRITSALQSGELEEKARAEISVSQSHVMMCGNSEMIRNVFAELEKRGMKKHLRREPGHITTEKYH